MITNISLTSVYCLDQDATRDFYVDVLGFRPHTDVTMGDGYRWVTVVHPNQPELEVTLMLPGPPLDEEAAEFITHQLEKGQLGGLGLRVDDCRKTFEELSGKGVTFLQEPADRPVRGRGCDAGQRRQLAGAGGTEGVRGRADWLASAARHAPAPARWIASYRARP